MYYTAWEWLCNKYYNTRDGYLSNNTTVGVWENTHLLYGSLYTFIGKIRIKIKKIKIEFNLTIAILSL